MTHLLLLVDGSSYLYRAYHALPALHTRTGQPTGAIFGTINMLRQLLAQHQPSHCAVVFDAPGGSFRNILYLGYKAQRPAMPDELVAQLEPLAGLISALGLSQLREPGVEADDVIATLTRQAVSQHWPVIIASSDKDLAQLVQAQVQLYNPFEQQLMDRAAVKAKYGVWPEQIRDYLALVGDSSDNVPGVPQVGAKTAARWLAEFGDLDALLAQADTITGRAGANLRAHRTTLDLARTLVSLRDDLSLPLELAALTPRPPDNVQLQVAYQQLEFTRWLRELPSDPPASEPLTPEPQTATQHYRALLTLADWQAYLHQLQQAPQFALDAQTTQLTPFESELVGIALAISLGEAVYVPLAHHYLGVPAQLDRAQVLSDLKPLLENPQCGKIGHNLKAACHLFAQLGIQLNGIAHDTLLAAYVLDSTAHAQGLDTLAQQHLHYTTMSYASLVGKGKAQLSFADVPIADASRYAAEAADITLKLHHTLWPQLQAKPQLCALYQDLEIPLVPVLARMERCGILLDSERLQRQSAELAAHLHTLETQLFDLAGTRFNPGSPKQLQTVLYTQLKLPALEKTPTGQPSTAESALQALTELHPIVPLILAHRSLSKLKSTYTDRLPAQVHPRSGRVHTTLHQAATSTGRLSSTDPNLQNIPIRTLEGRRIREAFVAPQGWVLLAADYSQIELRILAHWCEDPALLSAFQAQQDIHRATAAEVFGVALEQVSSDQRRAAKAINFGLIYGMSAFGLARQLGISREAAQAYLSRYFQRYPGVKSYMDALRTQAHEQGYVETLLGRRLYLPDLRARNAAVRQAAERAAINAPMQGSAADIIKRAMLSIDAWLQTTGSAAKMLLQVHDELVLEVPENQVEAISAQVRRLMSEAYPLKVPLVVDIGVGHNWDEAH